MDKKRLIKAATTKVGMSRTVLATAFTFLVTAIEEALHKGEFVTISGIGPLKIADNTSNRLHKVRGCKWFHIICISICLCSSISCNSQERNSVARTTRNSLQFVLPEIPTVLTDTGEKQLYLCQHYWDNFDFTDTALISQPEITEQAWVDYLAILSHIPFDKAENSLATLLNATSVNTPMFLHFIELSEKYLYDPNSPYRNEDYYILILKYIVSSPRIAEPNKIRPQYQLETVLKNRPGEAASNFVYTLPNGRTGKLYEIIADYTILFFNNPDCHDCLRVKEFITASPIFSLKRDKLAILAVYPDANIPLWKAAAYPPDIINSYDAGRVISKKQLYDLKVIPVLYLLDKDKKVILKDVPVERIEQYLKQNI